MIIPDYWDEHKESRTVSKNRKKTVSRFGWSDVSQQAAKEHAQTRVDEAFQKLSE